MRVVLPSFLSVYRSTSHTVTRKSLYFLVSSREVRGKIKLLSLATMLVERRFDVVASREKRQTQACMVLAERVNDRRTVARSTSDSKGT